MIDDIHLPSPRWHITADDKPLSSAIDARVMSITVTDNRSDTADELEITLDDHDGALNLPKRGVNLHVWMGWADGLYDKGQFTVDESDWEGTPDIITVKARAADFTSTLKVGNRQSYHQQTFGQIASIIAQKHKLTLNMTDALKNINLEHVDQTDESDIHLLTRLAKAYGAEVSIKQKRLLIFKAGTAKTSSGKPLPKILITRADGDKPHYSENDRDHDYTGVVAYYQDDDKARRTGVHVGDDTKEKRLRGTYASPEQAEAAANAEKDRLNRNMATFTLTKPIGMPEISTESPVELQGYKPQIDKLDWIVSRAIHHLEVKGGITTDLELEASLD